MKKIIALVLSAIMLFSLVACGKSATESKQPDAGSSEPVTLTFWSKFSPTSKNGEALQTLVDEFNASNDKNITVEVEYIEGGTSGIMSAIMTAYVSGETPEMIMMDNSTVPVLYENDILADVTSYVEASNFDMSNIIDQMSKYSYSDDGSKIISIPFARSSVVYVYNQDMFNEYGLTAPKNWTEFKSNGATILDKAGIPSAWMGFDASFYQEAMLVGMGSDGNLSKDGTKPAALDDGSMAELLTEWKSWIDAGYCMAPDVTDAENVAKEAFYQGKVAGLIVSTGAIGGIYSACEEAGINVGVGYMFSKNGYSTGSGGSQIAAVNGKSDNVVSACWDFMKFMMSDHAVSFFSIESGYLPTTYSSLTDADLLANWEKKPGYQIAVDQMEYASEPYWSIYRNEWNSVVKTAMSNVTQNGDSVDSAIEYMKSQVSTVFG